MHATSARCTDVNKAGSVKAKAIEPRSRQDVQGHDNRDKVRAKPGASPQ